ncbi:MAG: hypothetical protein ACKVQR_13845 [Aquabacterium sp.]
MERLLTLHLTSEGCAAEALLNGIPVASTSRAGGECLLPVHEFTLTGANRLDLTAACVTPGQESLPQPCTAVKPTWARLRLLLVRQGRSPMDDNARQLAEISWAAPRDKSFEAPVTLTSEVELPINFPRWKWLDAPPISFNPGTRRLVVEFLQQMALDLSLGRPDGLIAAAKLRFDELALAYQMTPAQAVQRFRDHLQARFEAKALNVLPPAADEVVLRPILDGHMIEALSPAGTPVLRTQNTPPPHGECTWPMRLAVVEGRIYVLR